MHLYLNKAKEKSLKPGVLSICESVEDVIDNGDEVLTRVFDHLSQGEHLSGGVLVSISVNEEIRVPLVECRPSGIILRRERREWSVSEIGNRHLQS